MKERDYTKKNIHKMEGSARLIAIKKFKTLRNKATYLLRNDEKINVEKIMKSDGRSDPWKVVNHCLKTKTENNIPIKNERGELIKDKELLANKLSEAFKEKNVKCKRKGPASEPGPFEQIQK